MLIQVVGRSTIGYTPFTFPDGQRHITLEGDVSYSVVTITTSLTCADDLFDLLLVTDILKTNHNEVDLRIDYLTGGRMDRPINSRQPFTLKVVTDIIKTGGFRSVLVLDPHSSVSTYLLGATTGMPNIGEVLAHYDSDDTVIVIPDKGAGNRVLAMTDGTDFTVTSCSKERDLATGKLSGFVVHDPDEVKGKRCLIIDDICDGGGTFVGLAKVLRAAGAKSVDLFVTHGIFSKGRVLEGIDEIYSTDSFQGKVWPKDGTRTTYDWPGVKPWPATSGFCTCTWGGQPHDEHRVTCPKFVDHEASNG